MASNHTQHYSLSQWQPTDEVVRTDFNADNAKIDAALFGLETGKLGRSEHIKTFTVETSATSFTVPLDDVDWSQWETVSVFFKCPPLSSDKGTTIVTLNDGRLPCQGNTANALASSGVCPIRVIFFPGHRADSLITAAVHGSPGGAAYSEHTYSEITSIRFEHGSSSSSYSYKFPVGAEVIVSGRK